MKSFDLDAVSSDVQDMIRDLPIHVENRIRANMLASIFYTYGKRQLDKGKSLFDVRAELAREMDVFAQKQGTFCNGDYTNKVFASLDKYAQSKYAVSMETINTFLRYSADGLTKHITDGDILRDLEVAHESLNIPNEKNLYTMEFAMYYLDKCVRAVSEVCRLDAGFVQSLKV